MFNFFKKKPSFDLYYSKFISQPIVRKCELHKSITAAYLYVLSDFNYSDNYIRRRENANDIFSFLDNHFSNEEMNVFDKVVDLFGKVIRKEIMPRGDWCFYNEDNGNALQNIFLCYGDLINNPSSIDNYEEAPIIIRGLDVQMMFAAEFNDIILHLTGKYIKSLR